MTDADRARHLHEISIDELEGVTGGTGDEPRDDTSSVSCPVCGCRFGLPEGKKIGKCPDCGASVKAKENWF